MKKILINTLMVTAILSLGACQKKNLDLYPYSTIGLDQSFVTVKDAKAWDNGFYASLRGRVYGNYTITQDVQADQLNASLDYGNRNGFPHRWGTFYLADNTNISGVWSGYYSALKDINNAIANFGKITTTSAAEKTELDKYLGDAYLSRAFYYTELILRFGKPFEPATAATDPGVPLVLTYEIAAQPARATVKQVYDQILSDIGQAKTLIGTTAGVAGATTFTKDAVLALEARVRLYMQDWAGAKTAADAVIATNTYPLINTLAGLQAMWTNDVNTEVIFRSFHSQPNELGNTNSIYLGFNAASGKFTPDFFPTQWMLDLYENTDIRKATYFKVLPTIVQGVNYTTLSLVNKYPGNPALFTTAATNYQHSPKVFRSAEMYLISAEAAFNAGNTAAATATLNTLRVARGVAAVTGLTGTALRDAIRDERNRELAFEGFRLWDLKRWHLGFSRTAPQSLGPIQQGDGFTALVVPVDAEKYVWAIPTNDININKNLTQNPGWQ